MVIFFATHPRKMEPESTYIGHVIQTRKMMGCSGHQGYRKRRKLKSQTPTKPSMTAQIKLGLGLMVPSLAYQGVFSAVSSIPTDLS